MSAKTRFKLVTRYPVKRYKCGLRAGDTVRLKHDLPVYDHEGNLLELRKAGEIWRVLRGPREEPRVLWLRQPDGETHTWADDASVFESFEKLR